MIPESSENGDIRLYKSIDFPHKWEFEKQLMVDVDAADTMNWHGEQLFGQHAA